VELTGDVAGLASELRHAEEGEHSAAIVAKFTRSQPGLCARVLTSWGEARESAVPAGTLLVQSAPPASWPSGLRLS